MEFLLLLLGLVLGAVVGWLTRQVTTPTPEPGLSPEAADARRDAVVAEVRREEAQARASVQADLAAASGQLQALQQALTDTREQYEARLAATRDQYEARLTATQQQHEQYVAHRRTTEQEREQSERGHNQVLQKLTPVAQQLQAMQRRVEELEQQRKEQHGALTEQLRATEQTVVESRKAAEQLSKALSNNAVRGVWGETQLRTLVESAGLMARVDFDLQANIEADSGARRPDMVVNLPGGKQMAVDAKVPYSSFMDAHREGIGPEERHLLLTDHAKQVRRHVDALASKAYWSGLEASPEFTVAFIPNDQLLAAALEADPSLMEYAFGKGIVLATPTNLWAILKTVAFTWRQENLTEDAKQVFDLGTELYRRICKLSEHAEKLRRSLEGTVKSYNAFASSLESRVLVTARKLDQMDESSLLAQATEIETVPKALTSSDFEVIADLDRAELDLGLETVEAEIVEDDRKSG
jgi:DNA recombination protein RmuC